VEFTMCVEFAGPLLSTPTQFLLSFAPFVAQCQVFKRCFVVFTFVH